jgi:ubiquinone biosynthesis protein UbiJ
VTSAVPPKPEWLNELPELLQGAAQELKSLADAGTEPMREQMDLASAKQLDQLRHLVERIEQRVSQLEQKLDELEKPTS